MALHARVTRVARTCYARYTFVFHPLHVRVTVSGGGVSEYIGIHLIKKEL